MTLPFPRRFGPIAAVTVAVVFGACTDTPAPLAPSDATVAAPALSRGPTTASAPAPTPAQRQFEIKFRQDMIDHHHMAIMMAELCLQKAVHGDLRALCTDIIAAQRAEIEQMQSWLRSWYGISYQPQMKPGDMKQMEKLAALDGAEFEIAFMEMMIKHHAKAVKEGEHCLDKAYHAELKQLCQNIVETQTQEIALMQSWLCAWYSICH